MAKIYDDIDMRHVSNLNFWAGFGTGVATAVLAYMIYLSYLATNTLHLILV